MATGFFGIAVVSRRWPWHPKTSPLWGSILGINKQAFTSSTPPTHHQMTSCLRLPGGCSSLPSLNRGTRILNMASLRFWAQQSLQWRFYLRHLQRVILLNLESLELIPKPWTRHPSRTATGACDFRCSGRGPSQRGGAKAGRTPRLGSTRG